MCLVKKYLFLGENLPIEISIEKYKFDYFCQI